MLPFNSHFLSKFLESGYSGVARWHKEVSYTISIDFKWEHHTSHVYRRISYRKIYYSLFLMMVVCTGPYWLETQPSDTDWSYTPMFQVVDMRAKIAEYYDSFHHDHPSYWKHIKYLSSILYPGLLPIYNAINITGPTWKASMRIILNGLTGSMYIDRYRYYINNNTKLELVFHHIIHVGHTKAGKLFWLWSFCQPGINTACLLVFK